MNRLKDECVSTEHLLLALAGQQQGEAAHMVQEAGVTRERIDAVFEARRPAGGPGRRARPAGGLRGGGG
jgi:ATP-dependent Clp protease ATP-binding subunit ClpA